MGEGVRDDIALRTLLQRIVADLFGGITSARATNYNMRTSRNYTYGNAELTLQPNGLWDIKLPANYDDSNPANFVQLNTPACISGGTNPATCTGQAAVAAGPNGPATPAYLVSQMPLTTPSFGIQYSPRLGESTEKIGKLEDVYVDVENDEPQFGTVKEGFVGRHLTFVPLGGITVGPDELRAPVTKEQVKAAPNIELHGEELSQADESALYHHFGLNYTPPDTESGRRLARR